MHSIIYFVFIIVLLTNESFAQINHQEKINPLLDKIFVASEELGLETLQKRPDGTYELISSWNDIENLLRYVLGQEEKLLGKPYEVEKKLSKLKKYLQQHFKISEEIQVRDWSDNEQLGKKIKPISIGTQIITLNDLSYQIYHIEGDGSCWVRALLMVTWQHISTSESQWLSFSKKLQKIQKKNINFLYQSRIQDLIAILNILRKKNIDETIDMLSFQKVDEAINISFRQIISNLLHDLAANRAIMQEIAQLTELKDTPAGPLQIKAFCQFFDIEFIGYDQEKKGWVNSNGDLAQFSTIPQLAPYISPVHYDFLFRLRK